MKTKHIHKLFLFALFFLITLCWGGKPANAALPSGFQKETLVNSGLVAPTAIEFAPDGRLFILEQSGKIKIYKNGVVLPNQFDELPALADSDKGLLGIAFDPDWNTNHWVYFYYVDNRDGFHKIVRFDSEGDIAKNGPIEIFNSRTVPGPNHAGGSIGFGPDGKLYLAIGDGNNSGKVQDPSTIWGKMLRMNKDGTVPTDNPYFGQTSKNQYVWALGFRNPFRWQFDSLTGKLFEGEVGESTWEEINVVEKLGNYGWPLKEGNCFSNCSGFTDPLYSYNHNGSGASVTGGFVYRGSQFPSEFQGKYFFGDYANRFIKTLVWDLHADGSVHFHDVEDFDTGAGAVADMKVGPDGKLYYLSIFPGILYRVSYNTSGNLPPIAKSSSNIANGIAPLTVNFSSSGSKDPENKGLSYLWNFGDGTTSASANPVKTYNSNGVYDVNLTVSDGVNSASALPLTIQVGKLPTLNIISPTHNSLYRAGDTINYEATAVDGNGVTIPDSNFNTEVRFHHNTHYHPFQRPTNIRKGSFQIPTNGEVSDDVWFEIIFSAKDSVGLTSTRVINIYPRKSKLTLITDPVGLTVNLDNQPKTGPVTVTAVVGMKREISAGNQSKNGQYYEFLGWSNNGLPSQTLTISDVDLTLTAKFSPAVPFKGEYYLGQFSGSPILTRDDFPINFIWNNGSPDPVVPVDNFSVRWTKQTQLNSGTYKFSATSDDGMRVYVDGVMIIDDWQGHGTVTVTKNYDITNSGLHEIKVEYYEGGGGATAKFDFVKIADLPNSVVLPVINNFVSNTNNILAGAPVVLSWNVTGADSLNLNNGLGSVTGTSQKIVNPITNTQYILTATNSAGTTSKVLDITVVKDQNPSDYNMKYWNFPPSPKGTAPIFPSTPPDASETAGDIDFNWGTTTGPLPGIGKDYWLVEATATKQFEDGVYIFDTLSDDGIRLYIDGQLLIDQWNDHGTTRYTKEQVVTKGFHDIKLQFYERTVLARLALTITKKVIPNTWAASCYSNKNLSGSPSYTQNYNSLNFVWNGGSPDASIPNDLFSCRFVKNTYYNAGAYTFKLTGDDGIRMYIDGQLVINQWHDQGSTTYTATKTLAAGTHEIKIEYYEAYGGALLRLDEPI